MKTLIFFSVFIIFDCFGSSTIVGGKPVDFNITDTSYIVRIGNSCAGSIISAKWILTAAHCEKTFDDRITVRNKAGKYIRLKVLKSYIHPKYKKDSNDIALLELRKEIDFTEDQLSLIEIADANLESTGGLPEGLMTTVYGWGDTRENGASSSVLREVDVPLVSRETANLPQSYKGKINETMLVAGYPEGKKDSCQGDSGGPMVIKNETTGSFTLIGIVSFGDGCGRAKKFGVYSNVAHANEWILTLTQK